VSKENPPKEPVKLPLVRPVKPAEILQVDPSLITQVTKGAGTQGQTRIKKADKKR
jgi:hypothetical protein